MTAQTPSFKGADQPLRGIALICLAVLLFASHDALSKYLSGFYPIVMVVWARYVVHTLLMLVVFVPRTGLSAVVRTRRPLLQLARALCLIGTSLLFTTGLRYIPLAEATAVNFLAPLMVTALSVPLLGERVGPRRWVAIGVGLIGVLVVLRPGMDGFISLPGLMVLLAATAYAIAAVTVSLLTRTDTPQAMVVWFLLIMAVGAGLLAWPQWQPLQWRHAGLIAGMGLAGALGQIALTRAFQLGQASMIAPLEYTGLVWVIGWDLLLWGVLPDRMTWIGAAIIVASGLYLLHRERVQHARRAGQVDHP